MAKSNSAQNGVAEHAQPEERVRELEKQLATLQQERDDLTADVEALCMQGDSGIFNSSSVLTERIHQSEREGNKLRAQLTAIRAERDELREDLINHRASKRAVDASWREERARAERLEAELHFYQTQSATAMANRDKAVWEAEELRESTLALEERMQRAEGTADAARTQATEARRQLATAQERIGVLEGQVVEVAELPQIRAELATTQHRATMLQAERDDLQAELAEARKQLAEVSANADRLGAEVHELQEALTAADTAEEDDAAAHAAELHRLQDKLATVEAERAALAAEMEDHEGTLAAAQAEVHSLSSQLQRQLEQAHKEASTREAAALEAHKRQFASAQSELEELRSRYQITAADLDKARTEQASAVARAAAAEETAMQAAEELGAMRDAVQDLRERLHQATQEKVAALMQAAEARGSHAKARPTGQGPGTWLGGWGPSARAALSSSTGNAPAHGASLPETAD